MTLHHRITNRFLDLLRWLNADDDRHVLAVCGCVLMLGLVLGIATKLNDNPNHFPRVSAVRG